MLVLSRKAGQSIVIGQDVIVTVRRTTSGRVVLMIDAPRSTSVRRGEIDKEDPAKRVNSPAR